MPSGLRRFQQTGQMHFITFSCYRRQPKLARSQARSVFERSLERTRRAYGFCVAGYVVMPEHVHLLLTEPETTRLATALQALKQSVSRSLALRASEPFWQARYYDFNVWTDKKRIEKLRYMHRNPVARGLVESPEDWNHPTDEDLSVGAGPRRVVEFSALCDGTGRRGRDRVRVDSAAARAGGDSTQGSHWGSGPIPAQAELGRGTPVGWATRLRTSLRVESIQREAGCFMRVKT
ncbi:MAG TPA: transposase [Terracidiphilus sp.]|nr:transposase [Terracidiphilus sp.]